MRNKLRRYAAKDELWLIGKLLVFFAMLLSLCYLWLHIPAAQRRAKRQMALILAAYGEERLGGEQHCA